MQQVIGIILLVALALVGVLTTISGFLMIVFDRETINFDTRPRPLDPTGPVVLAIGCSLIVIAVVFLQ